MTLSSPAAFAFGAGLGFGIMFGALALVALAQAVRAWNKRRAEKSA